MLGKLTNSCGMSPPDAIHPLIVAVICIELIEGVKESSRYVTMVPTNTAQHWTNRQRNSKEISILGWVAVMTTFTTNRTCVCFLVPEKRFEHISTLTSLTLQV
jgi:hypothetical protein